MAYGFSPPRRRQAGIIRALIEFRQRIGLGEIQPHLFRRHSETLARATGLSAFNTLGCRVFGATIITFLLWTRNGSGTSGSITATALTTVRFVSLSFAVTAPLALVRVEMP